MAGSGVSGGGGGGGRGRRQAGLAAAITSINDLLQHVEPATAHRSPASTAERAGTRSMLLYTLLLAPYAQQRNWSDCERPAAFGAPGRLAGTGGGGMASVGGPPTACALTCPANISMGLAVSLVICKLCTGSLPTNLNPNCMVLMPRQQQSSISHRVAATARHDVGKRNPQRILGLFPAQQLWRQVRVAASQHCCRHQPPKPSMVHQAACP